MQAEAVYHPSADQLELIDALDASIGELLPIDRLHKARGETAETWSQLRELGVFDIALPEDVGGSGLGAAEEALMALSLGRRLAAPSVLATLGVAHARPTDGSASFQGRSVAAGFVSGGRTIIVGDDEAELVLVRDGTSARVIKRPPLGNTVEDFLWGEPLRAAAGAGETVGEFDAAGLLRLRLLDAAALAGVAATALDEGVAYANMREQFGRPIGSFQAVKHHCANMAIAARCARDQTSYASVAVDAGRADAALQVECAFYVAGQAALDNAGKNIQIHGGIGFSDEANPHLFVKRAQLLAAIAGGLEAANERIADMKVEL
jgi:alkylation response protein AidB-like acyl-CoA dehydrogenase